MEVPEVRHGPGEGGSMIIVGQITACFVGCIVLMWAGITFLVWLNHTPDESLADILRDQWKHVRSMRLR